MGRTFTILVVLVALVGGGGWWAYHHFHHRASTRPHLTGAGGNQPPGKVVQPPNNQPTVPPLPSFAMGGVHKGEGKESPVIRELTANPDLAKGSPYAFDGKGSVQAWANRTAHRLAVHAGWFGPKHGRDDWVRVPDTVYIAVRNDGKGNISLVQYSPTEYAGQVAAQTKTSPPPNANPVRGVTTDNVQLTAVYVFPVSPPSAASQFVSGAYMHDNLPAPLSVYDWVHYPG